MMARTWDHQVYVYIGEQRSPAAVRSLSDFSPLDGRRLHQAVEKQLLAGVQFLKKDGQIGVAIGHFLTKNDQGRREFACRVQSRPGVFDQMELTFVGQGISENGEVPKLVVEGPCVSANDLTQTSPLWIPLHQLYTDNIKELQLWHNQEPTNVNLVDMTSEWPKTWTLERVKLFNSAEPDQALYVDLDRYRGFDRARLSFRFQP